MNPLEIGETLDHYRLDKVVARSGMATLYRATDLNDEREVAIKIPHPEMESDPILLERFRREQEIGQELDHPGVVKTYDGEQRSRLYMVIEWVDGRLLRSVLNEKGKLPIDRAVALTVAICEALEQNRIGFHLRMRRLERHRLAGAQVRGAEKRGHAGARNLRVQAVVVQGFANSAQVSWRVNHWPNGPRLRPGILSSVDW